MPQELQIALELQRMDRILHDLEAEIRSLPKKIGALEQQLAAQRKEREVAEAAIALTRQEIKRLDHSTQDARAKIEKLRKQIMQATTQDQLTAFQHEIEFAEKSIAENEAAELELLEKLETLEAELASAAETEKAAEITFAQQQAEANALSEQDRKKGVKLFKERTQLHGTLPQKFRDEYDRLRKAHRDGIVVADASDGTCSGCLMTIRPALMQQIRSDANTIFRCESCHRLLVYNPPR
jgi:hypothetical protein